MSWQVVAFAYIQEGSVFAVLVALAPLLLFEAYTNSSSHSTGCARAILASETQCGYDAIGVEFVFLLLIFEIGVTMLAV